MDHNQATQLAAVEKYLLEELTPELREEFEAHFFDCQECALDLRATDAFVLAAKQEFSASPVRTIAAVKKSKSPFAMFWPSAAAWSALAASLLLIAYQNLVSFPRIESQVAELRSPEVLPALSLVGGNSRGGSVPTAAVPAGQPFLLSLDLPAEEHVSSYSCLLYSPSGALLWRVEVAPQLAKDTISIRVPSLGKQSGNFTLVIKGNKSDEGATDLARYRFTLTANR
jgi:hypothetical protein